MADDELTHFSDGIITEGDIIEIVGFDCIPNGSMRRVNRGGDGMLYVFCEDGQHLLDEELDANIRRGHCCITKIDLRSREACNAFIVTTLQGVGDRPTLFLAELDEKGRLGITLGGAL